MAGYSKMDALQALVGGQITVYSDGTDPIYHDGQTPPSEEEIDAKIAELKAEYDAIQYQRDRQYTDLGEQLDMQYWDQVNGTTTWKDAIAKIKSDNPKPE